MKYISLAPDSRDKFITLWGTDTKKKLQEMSFVSNSSLDMLVCMASFHFLIKARRKPRGKNKKNKRK